MSEFALRFATDELERANRDAEAKRLAWKIARAASPSVVDIASMEAYCEAADYAAEALNAWENAQMEAQADWVLRHREAEQSGVRSPLDSGEPPALSLSPDGGLARREAGQRPVRLAVSHTHSRED